MPRPCPVRQRARPGTAPRRRARPPRRWRATLAALASSALAGSSLACSSTPTGTIRLVYGEGAATADGVTSWSVAWVDAQDQRHPIATGSAAATTIDLGALDQSTAGILQITGDDSAGNPVVFGSSPELAFGDLAGATLSLFVQRLGDVAALPNALPDARPWPRVATVAGRYVFVAGGSDPSLGAVAPIYDLEALAPLPSRPPLPLAAETMAFVGAGTRAYVFGHPDGSATAAAVRLDFQTGATTALSSPPGTFGFGDVVGGAVVGATDGSGAQFVVGATRTTGAPTGAVLQIDASGALSWLALKSARWGAAAAWDDGVGVIVAGGDPQAPAIEILDPSSPTTSRALAYPADPAVSSGAALVDARTVVVAGGLMPDGSGAGVRIFDLTCSSACVAGRWPALPSALLAAQAFAVSALSTDSPRAVTVVGTDLGGVTRVFLAASTGIREAPTAVVHRGARAVASPLGPAGSVLLVGGADRIESFVPALM